MRKGDVKVGVLTRINTSFLLWKNEEPLTHLMEYLFGPFHLQKLLISPLIV